MFRIGFDSGGARQQMFARRFAERDHVGYFRFAVSQSAGFVHRHGFDLPDGFDIFAAFDQRAFSGSVADCRVNRNRRGDNQSARAGDDQNRNRLLEPRIKRLTEKKRRDK